MTFDAHKNFAYSVVGSAPSPGTAGTVLAVTGGDGTLFPAVPFNATVWPANSRPLAANAEIVRVTAIATDTFTVTRTQESTAARSITVGDQIAATTTKKTLTDIEAAAGGAMTLICDSTLGSDQASFDTDTILGGNIPGTYKHLRLELKLRSTNASAGDTVLMVVNNDGTSADYLSERDLAQGSTASASAHDGTLAGMFLGSATGGGSPTNSFATFAVDIIDYAATDNLKHAISLYAAYSSSSAPKMDSARLTSTWLSASAITRLKISPQTGPNFKAGSRFTLWGLS